VYGYENGYDGENSDFPAYIAKRSTYPYSYTNSQAALGTAPGESSTITFTGTGIGERGGEENRVRLRERLR